MLINYQILLNFLKRYKKIYLFFIILLILIFIRVFLASEDEIKVKVFKVINGDSIMVFDDSNKIYNVRLFGIDAPKIKQTYGKEAKEYLKSLILNKNIDLIIKSKDKYDRMMAIAFYKDINVNSLMVKNGFAWAYIDYSDLYIKEQEYAKTNKKGLWAFEKPISPQKWRKINKF